MQEIINYPINTVKKIYSHFNIPFTCVINTFNCYNLRDSLEVAMTKWLADNPQGKHGKVNTTLEMWGLSAEDIKTEFSEYIEKFCNAKC